MPLATLEYRTQTLVKLSRQRPLLVRFYALSSWSYSVTGIFYLACYHRLQPAYQTTPVISGFAFGIMLCLQGLCSHCNDAVTTLGYELWPHRLLYLYCDRLSAATLLITAYTLAAGGWPSSGASDPRYPIGLALAATCTITATCATYRFTESMPNGVGTDEHHT